ncbi:HTH-type transcriptional regulator KdgR [Pontiella desulfatans]|uniref:HTH-type transcriptional regulator KdgR n=1 Tax=Pontiella desulfatans TaxID=2750659 RepID=A0A6C2TVZ2_PONDE|nr:LacI family DNA-binding transcriptional regulator [Pontiella desulfatans]VGO11727.1 HTH-type transcriptional regulator KdgR [Pontiella desulfatans]
MSEKPDHNGARRVTLRDIAKELGVSHVTVSKALRNQSGASEELKARIQAKAEEMGYQPDPMLAALSHYRKSSKTKPVQASLAWINTWTDPNQLRQFKEFDLYWQGAAESARRLGFKLQEFSTAEIPLRRLETILKTRNIQGILLPPLRDPVEGLQAFDWSSFAVVRFGQAIPFPETHFVTGAQMADTMLAFDRAHQLGYERIGFVCEYWRMRFFGVGYSWAQKTLPPKQQLPLLTLNQTDDFEHQQSVFEKWIAKAKPDAILTDNSNTLKMLSNLGYRIPEDLGLATTSIHDTPIDAGIDQRPFEIGRAAVRTLVSLLVEKNFGIPDCRNEILIEGQWIDGSMLPPRT